MHDTLSLIGPSPRCSVIRTESWRLCNIRHQCHPPADQGSGFLCYNIRRTHCTVRMCAYVYIYMHEYARIHVYIYVYIYIFSLRCALQRAAKSRINSSARTVKEIY